MIVARARSSPGYTSAEREGAAVVRAPGPPDDASRQVGKKSGCSPGFIAVRALAC